MVSARQRSILVQLGVDFSVIVKVAVAHLRSIIQGDFHCPFGDLGGDMNFLLALLTAFPDFFTMAFALSLGSCLLRRCSFRLAEP